MKPSRDARAGARCARLRIVQPVSHVRSRPTKTTNRAKSPAGTFSGSKTRV